MICQAIKHEPCCQNCEIGYNDVDDDLLADRQDSMNTVFSLLKAGGISDAYYSDVLHAVAHHSAFPVIPILELPFRVLDSGRSIFQYSLAFTLNPYS